MNDNNKRGVIIYVRKVPDDIIDERHECYGPFDDVTIAVPWAMARFGERTSYDLWYWLELKDPGKITFF